jgi:hypothetical protein
MAEEIWSVRLPSGDVRRGSLDELDAAFEAGHIDENALVLAPGATTWTKLGELAGLDDDAPPAPPPAAISFAPPAIAYASPNSLRPVMTDLDDLSFDEPRRRSKAPILMGIVGVAALAGGIVFAVHQFATGSEMSTATAAVVAPPQVTAPPAPPPPPPAVTVGDSAPASIGPSLTDAQKQALIAVDQKHAKESKAQKKAREAANAAAGGGWQHHSHSSTAEPKRKAGQACTCAHGDPLCTCL